MILTLSKVTLTDPSVNNPYRPYFVELAYEIFLGSELSTPSII
jgi:hypothetical protein